MRFERAVVEHEVHSKVKTTRRHRHRPHTVGDRTRPHTGLQLIARTRDTPGPARPDPATCRRIKVMRIEHAVVANGVAEQGEKDKKARKHTVPVPATAHFHLPRTALPAVDNPHPERAAG
jgi:hypothetical protein